MSELHGKTIVVSADMHFKHTANAIWPLLCPVREYDWIEHWNCELVHSRSGVNELGCVFFTDFPTEGDRETWVTTKFEPLGRIEFARVNRSRAIRFVIELEPEERGTSMRWTQYVTPLDENGIEYIQGKRKAFEAQMKMLETLLSHYLETGKMLKGGNLGLTDKIGAHVHDRTAG